MLLVDNPHKLSAPEISQAGVDEMVTVFEHSDAIPFNVVIKCMVNVARIAGTVMFTVCSVLEPAIPAPVTVQK